MNITLRNQLEASLALTDAERLPPRQYPFESPKEHRERAARVEAIRRDRYAFETLEEYFSRRRRPGGLDETPAQALRNAYHNARNEWATWFWHDKNRWCGLDQDGLDAMSGAFERAIELRNMIYGTER